MNQVEDTAPTTSEHLGGIYQVLPVSENLPALNQALDWEMVQKLFPARLEAYCIATLLSATEELNTWVGASYAYVDRLAICSFRHSHQTQCWHSLWDLVRSRGRINRFTGTDIKVWLTNDFIHPFWSSMRGLIHQGYIRTETVDIQGLSIELFYPTRTLIHRLTNGQMS